MWNLTMFLKVNPSLIVRSSQSSNTEFEQVDSRYSDVLHLRRSYC